MSNAPTDKQRNITALFYALLVLLVVYTGSIVFGDKGFLHLQRMQAELEQVKAENASIEEENNALYHTVHRLKNDPVYIEHVIRKQLQMNAPGEIIFKFEKQ